VALRVELWTDGSGTASGPGGWAFVLRAIDTSTGEVRKEVERSGGEYVTTSQVMEATALLEGLRAIERATVVYLYTDSKYVAGAFAERWLDLWEARGWKKVKHPAVWQDVLRLVRERGLDVRAAHVKGHTGVALNERCDELAGAERRKRKDELEGEQATLELGDAQTATVTAPESALTGA
jgi:ribonuclease HI